MEKIWTSEAAMKYPEKWIVMVNLEESKEIRKAMGEVYFVTSDQREAYAKDRELGDSMGKTIVIAGHNQSQSEVGGLWNSQ